VHIMFEIFTPDRHTDLTAGVLNPENRERHIW
jgi:hypothetical protein